MNDAVLKPGERLDDLQLSGYMIIQDPERFCFGVDAVLLTDFVKVKKEERVLDLGTGTGVIPILLEAKTNGAHFTGLEIQEESADMARRSVQYNGISEKVDIVTGDIKEAAEIFKTASFDVITTVWKICRMPGRSRGMRCSARWRIFCGRVLRYCRRARADFI